MNADPWGPSKSVAADSAAERYRERCDAGFALPGRRVVVLLSGASLFRSSRVRCRRRSLRCRSRRNLALSPFLSDILPSFQGRTHGFGGRAPWGWGGKGLSRTVRGRAVTLPPGRSPVRPRFPRSGSIPSGSFPAIHFSLLRFTPSFSGKHCNLEKALAIPLTVLRGIPGQHSPAAPFQFRGFRFQFRGKGFVLWRNFVWGIAFQFSLFPALRLPLLSVFSRHLLLPLLKRGSPATCHGILLDTCWGLKTFPQHQF